MLLNSKSYLILFFLTQILPAAFKRGFFSLDHLILNLLISTKSFLSLLLDFSPKSYV